MIHSDEFWATYKFCYILQANSRSWARKRKYRRREEYATEKFQRCTNERSWSVDSLSAVARKMVLNKPKKPDSVGKQIRAACPQMAIAWPYPVVAAFGCILGFIMLIAMRDMADVIAMVFPF